MASKGGVTIVVAGEDKTGEVFNAVKKHLDETRDKAKDTGDSIAQVGETIRRGLEITGLAIGVREVIGGLKEMITTTMETAVQIGHLSQQTGISVQNLSALKYAAQATGVDFDVLTRGFRKLAVTVYDADSGNKKAVAGFLQLGISADQLRGRGDDMYSVLSLLAQKFHDMPEGIAKSDAAAKIFGTRMGSDMIPVLNELGGQMDELQSQARAMGVIWDEDGIKKMEEMHKQSEDLKESFQGLGMQITSSLAEPLGEVAKIIPQVFGFGGMGAHGNDFAAGIDAMARGLRGFLRDMAEAGLRSEGFTADADRLHQQFLAQNIAEGQPRGFSFDRFMSDMRNGKFGPNNHTSPPPPPPGAGDENTGLPLSTFHAPALTEYLAQQKQYAEDDAKAAAEALKELQKVGQRQWEEIANQMPDRSIFGSSKPSVTGGKDYTAFTDAGEKLAHGLFDPLFSFGMKWDQQWKQIKANLLRDVGELLESQLFSALFGDPEGRGGRGWNGGSWEGNTNAPGGRAGLSSTLLGGLMGIFHAKPAAATSNGGFGGGAGTIPSGAASLMQMGNNGNGGGGIQVVLNNNGAPLTVDSTQKQDGEAQVIQIMLKQMQTNGVVAQAIQAALLLA